MDVVSYQPTDAIIANPERGFYTAQEIFKVSTIRTYFQSMRDGGTKCILRFCYSNGMNESDKPWDADPALTLTHVAQVKPLIQEFADIIYVVQAGFIGSWGEWYYTENYDNASRKALLEALLEAVPDSRQSVDARPGLGLRECLRVLLLLTDAGFYVIDAHDHAHPFLFDDEGGPDRR